MGHIRNKLWLQIISGLLVGAICLWLSLRSIDLRQTSDVFGRISWPWIGAAIFGVVIVSAGKALRWQWLYPENARPVPLSGHFAILLIAQMLNLVVPVRLGELARLGLMQQEGRPVGLTLGTIAIEKSLDLLAVGLLLFLSVPMAVLPGWLRTKAGPGLLLTALGLLAGFWLVRATRGWLLRLLAHVPVTNRLPWARWEKGLLRLITSLLEAIAGLASGRLAVVLGLTAIVWAISAAVVQAMLTGFGIDEGWQAALVLMIALTFSNLVPTPPAMIGVVGAVTEAVLLPFGVAPVHALALGTLLNGVLVAPPVLLGSWAAGVRLARLLGRTAGQPLRQALGLAPLDRFGNKG